jgi:hypothetical protein
MLVGAAAFARRGREPVRGAGGEASSPPRLEAKTNPVMPRLFVATFDAANSDVLAKKPHISGRSIRSG